MQAHLEDRIIKIIIEETAVEIDELTPKSELVKDLELDSLDRIELAMQLEENLRIPEIPADKVHAWRTVQDVIESVRELADSL